MHSQQRGKYTRGRHTVKTVHISSEWQKKQNASFYQVVTTYVFCFKLSLLHKGRAIKWNNWEKKFCFFGSRINTDTFSLGVKYARVCFHPCEVHFIISGCTNGSVWFSVYHPVWLRADGKLQGFNPSSNDFSFFTGCQLRVRELSVSVSLCFKCHCLQRTISFCLTTNFYLPHI